MNLRYYTKKIKMFGLYLTAKAVGKDYYECDIDGLNIKLGFIHPYHHLMAKHFRDQKHEQPMLVLWKKLCAKAKGTIMDIGAYNGIYGIVAAKVSPNRVICVEPEEINVAQIRHNLALNDVKIQIFEKPLWNKLDKVFLNEHTGGTATSVRGNYGSRLTGMLDQFEGVSLIKLDAVGAELKILQGGEKVLRAHPIILIEVRPRLLEAMGNSEKELWEFVEVHGYKKELIYQCSDIRNYLLYAMTASLYEHHTN